MNTIVDAIVSLAPIGSWVQGGLLVIVEFHQSSRRCCDVNDTIRGRLHPGCRAGEHHRPLAEYRSSLADISARLLKSQLACWATRRRARRPRGPRPRGQGLGAKRPRCIEKIGGSKMAEYHTNGAKWQPLMLIADKRMECHICAALAIFAVLGQGEDKEGDEYIQVEFWCQECFRKFQDGELPNQEEYE